MLSMGMHGFNLFASRTLTRNEADLGKLSTARAQRISQRGQPLSTLNDSCVTASRAELECAGTKTLYWVRRLTPIAIT